MFYIRETWSVPLPTRLPICCMKAKDPPQKKSIKKKKTKKTTPQQNKTENPKNKARKRTLQVSFLDSTSFLPQFKYIAN